MNRVCLTWFLVVLASVCVAQPNKIEQLIRQLDQKNAQAVAKADTVALMKLWAPEFTLNRTNGTVLSGREKSLELIKQGMVSYNSFSVETETVVIKNAKLAVSMGSEVVVSASNRDSKAQRVKRRFTNVWIKQKGEWQLLSRHANNIDSN